MNKHTLKERPIIFSADSVQAILAERKTQTRRVIKPVRHFEHSSICKPCMAADPWAVWWHGPDTEIVGCLQVCPHGVPGDRLWVRETWWSYKSPELEMAAYEDGASRTLLSGGKTHDEPVKEIPLHGSMMWHPAQYDIWKKRPPIFMPRWASRLTLEVTGIRVERVQDISEADAIAEGFPFREHFIRTWDALNAKRGCGFDADPWVWVIEFRRLP